MSRWGVRIVGLIFLIIMLMMLFSIQKQLLKMTQQRKGSAPAATSTSR